MKRLYHIFLTAMLVSSCTSAVPDGNSIHSLKVDCCSGTKIQLDGDLGTVWNRNDKVSVFFADGKNNCWTYSGNDLSNNGEIRGTCAEGTDIRKKTAVFPYNGAMSISGNIIDGISLPSEQLYKPGSYGFALMYAQSESDALHFKYATAFVRVSIGGFGAVNSISVKARGGEKISGTASLNISDGSLSVSKGADVIYVRSNGSQPMEKLGGNGYEVFIAVPAGNYSDGFEVELTDGLSNRHILYYTGNLSLQPGEYITLNGESVKETSIKLSFHLGGTSNNPFKEDFPTTKFSGTDDDKYDKTFHMMYNGVEYEFYFHAEYDKAGYGYYIDGQKGLILGRAGAYIRLPKMDKHVFNRIIFTAGSTGSGPYIAVTEPGAVPSKSDKVSGYESSTVQGTQYEVKSDVSDESKDYHLVVNGGNVCMRDITFYYKRTK